MKKTTVVLASLCLWMGCDGPGGSETGADPSGSTDGPSGDTEPDPTGGAEASTSCEPGCDDGTSADTGGSSETDDDGGTSTGEVDEDPCPSLDDLGAQGEFDCTLVIGFSQTSNWFGSDANAIYEAREGIDPARWGLLWHAGAGIESWADPEYEGWNVAAPQTRWVSPCSEGFGDVDRVVLTVSSNLYDDESSAAQWAEGVEQGVQTVRAMLPNAERIVLQSVVGGTADAPCDTRASSNYPLIVEALSMVADANDDVVAGLMPQVDTCDEFADDKGHLTSEGSVLVAGRIAACYGDAAPR